MKRKPSSIFQPRHLKSMAEKIREIQEFHHGFGDIRIKFRAGRIVAIGLTTEENFSPDESKDDEISGGQNGN